MSRYCPVCWEPSKSFDQDVIADLLRTLAAGTPVAALIDDIPYAGQSENDDTEFDWSVRRALARLLWLRGGAMPDGWEKRDFFLLQDLPLDVYQPGDFKRAYDAVWEPSRRNGIAPVHRVS